MTDKTFSVFGSVRNANGVLKLRWANDLASRVKILDKAGCTDIHLVDLPEPMTKDEACRYAINNPDQFSNDPDFQSLCSFKIVEIDRAAARRNVKETLTKQVKEKAATTDATDPRIVKLMAEVQAEENKQA